MLFIPNDPQWSQTASDFGGDQPLRYYRGFFLIVQ